MQLIPNPPRYSQITATQREVWIEKYRRSGLSCRVFAQANGLNLSTFYGWLKKARRSPSSSAKPVVFQEISPLRPLTAPAAYSDGFRTAIRF